jgi:DNA-binding beta-propeller fold protein YncE
MLPQSGTEPGRLLLLCAVAAATACATPAEHLARPNRVVVAADGTVWVSDFQNDRLVRWGADGTFLGTWGRNGLGRGELWRVTSMVATPTGVVVANLRPVSDASGAEVVTELKSVDAAQEVGSAVLDGRSLASGARIDGLSLLGNGHLVLADSTHGELVEVAADGRHIGRFGGIPRPDAEPYGVTVSGEDVWVVERDRHRVTVISPGGRERTFTPRDEPLRFPTAVAVCTATEPAWVAVADHGNHKVRRFLLDGTPLSAFAPHPVGPDQPVQLLDLALSADCGALYLVDSKGDRVLVTDPNGSVLRTLQSW